MPREVLNAAKLKSLKPAPPGKRTTISDAIVPGLRVRTTDKGHSSFVVRSRWDGRQPSYRTIGEVGRVSLVDARRIAREWLESGEDPLLAKRREETARGDNVGYVVEEFLKRHVTGQRKARKVEQVIRREILPLWRDRRLAEITKADVVRLVDGVSDRGAKRQAYNVYGLIRLLFNWAIGRGIYGIEASPCDRLKPIALVGRLNIRTRVLNDAELAALGHALDRVDYPLAPLYRLLLLTGCRLTEVSAATWEEFGADVWTIPAARYKANAAHVLPITNEMRGVLDGLPRFAGPHLFTTTGGRRPVGDFTRMKKRLDDEMRKELPNLQPWQNHSIRRTVRTRLAGLRVPENVSELVIGHAKKGLARAYDLHAYEAEISEALSAWASALAAIVGTRYKE